MKKFTIVVFILIAGALVFIYFNQKIPVEKEEEQQYSKIITPLAPEVQEEKEESASNMEDSSPIVYVPLLPGEILLKSYSFNFSSNHDSEQSDDQVCAIRRSGSQEIILVLELYDAQTATYNRVTEVGTDITKFDTFSLMATDILGNHQNALIFSGFSDDNKTIMKVFLPEQAGRSYRLKKIAELQTEGTFSILIDTRSDSYATSKMQGKSYKIQELCPDPESENSLSQIQITYDYNKNLETYTKISEKKITGQMINARELAKILDGTTETFSRFLDGLWIKRDTDKNENRCIFFDKEKKEIICLLNDTQEVYTWNTDRMRRTGISIFTQNKSMPALSRRFDATLISTDDIKLKATDDLRMDIGEDTLWDGNYKKMDSFSAINFSSDETKPKFQDFIQTASNKWKSSDGWLFSFSGTNWYAEKEGVTQKGVFTVFKALEKDVIELRPSKDNAKSSFKGCYVPDIDTESRQLEELLTLRPVKLTTEGFSQNGEVIKLSRSKK